MATDENENANEETFDYDREAYPASYLIAIALLVFGLGAILVHHGIADDKAKDEVAATAKLNPDNFESLVDRVLESLNERRRRLPYGGESKAKKPVPPPTREDAERGAKVAKQWMQLSGIWPSEKPPECPEPKDPGCSLKCPTEWGKYQLQLHNFKKCKETEKERQQAWKQNNRTRGEYVCVPLTKEPPFPLINSEGCPKGFYRYDYYKNLDDYGATASHYAIANFFYKILKSGFFEDELGWMREGFEEYKANLPPEKSLEAFKASFKGKSYEAEALWETQLLHDEYLDLAFLGKPLTAPEWADGSPWKDWNGTTYEDHVAFKKAITDKNWEEMKRIRSKGHLCLFPEPLSKMLTRANKAMYDSQEKQEYKEEMYPMDCRRDTFTQSFLLTNMAGLVFEKPKKSVALPGFTNHNWGLAMDLSNWERAWPFLAMYAGVMCGYVGSDDKAHCAIAEWDVGFVVKEKKCEALVRVTKATGEAPNPDMAKKCAQWIKDGAWQDAKSGAGRWLKKKLNQ